MTQEREDAYRFECAVRKLDEDEDLRFFLRYVMRMALYGQNAFAANALTMAHQTGKQAVAQQVLHDITQVEPAFLSRLLKEEEDERRERDRDPGNAGRDY